MEDKPMFETFKNLLVEELQLDESTITMEAELKGDLNINSIELYDLAMMCEDKFGVEIEDEEAHKFVTIGDVVNYLEAHK
jgi:acyl carrier protein